MKMWHTQERGRHSKVDTIPVLRARAKEADLGASRKR
jgi:hypothetical protein